LYRHKTDSISIQNIIGDAATKIVHIPFIFLATVFITGFVAAINGPNVRSVLQVLVLLSPIFFEKLLNMKTCPSSLTVKCYNVRYQNVTYPENRGTAFALFNLSDDIGKGGGPVLVALLVRIFGDRRYSTMHILFSHHLLICFKDCVNILLSINHYTRPAFCIGILAWLLCGSALCLMTLTVTSDEALVTSTRVRKLQAEKI
jgi:hypothetical protein